MSHQFYIKQNDRRPNLQATLKDGDGDVVSLTGATVVFSMAAAGVVKVDNAAATLSDASGGVVYYAWAAGDTDTPGVYDGEFEVTFSDGTVETFPNSGHLKIIITKEVA